MKRLFFIFSVIILLGLTSTSCKKDDTTTPTPTPTPAPTNPLPAFPANMGGALVAIQTQTKPPVVIPGVPFTMINVGLAVAFFPGATAGTYVNAGNVSVNTKALTKDSSNMYIFNPDATNPLGLVFSTNPSWEVSGSSAVPAFTAMANSFPSDVNVTSSATVNSTADYTLTADLVSGADSLIYAVYGPAASLIKTKAGNSLNHTFTAAELATIGKGYGYIQITAYKLKQINNSGKVYWLINENVSTIGATIQ